MKTIYFLRHGETLFNRRRIHQFADTPLSERGVTQVQKTAERLVGKGVEVILASDLARTRESANLVAEKINAPVEYSELFRELKRPRQVQGMSYFSWRSLWMMGYLYLFGGSKTRHLSDEENIYDFHQRVHAALLQLEKRPESCILVVTHRGFIGAALADMKGASRGLIHRIDRGLSQTLFIENAALVTCTVDDTNRWQVVRDSE